MQVDVPADPGLKVGITTGKPPGSTVPMWQIIASSRIASIASCS